MPLSPFCARAAVIAFLAIGVGVAGNLFAFQVPRGQPRQTSGKASQVRQATDAARLDRLVIDAAGGGEAVAAVAGDRAESRRGRVGEAKNAENKGIPHRVGSFSPSSGKLALVTMPGADPHEARRATIRTVQAELARRGYEPGVADGAPGLVTRAAVLAYEHDQGLPLTADPSPEVLAHLRHGTSAPGAAVGLDAGTTPIAGHAEAVIRSVQQSLGALGYLAVSADGIVTDDTVRAIREFEMDAGLVPTGRISGPLVARLAKAQNRGKSETK